MPIIAVTNQKGGTAKTTTSLNVATTLAARGYSTIAVDNDPQGNLTTALRPPDAPPLYAESGPTEGHTLALYEEGRESRPQAVRERLSLIGATQQLEQVNRLDMIAVLGFRAALRRLAQEVDYVVVDCLPGFGVALSAAYAAAHYVLIPTDFEAFAIDGIDALLENAQMVGRYANDDLEILGILPTRVPAQETVLARTLRERLVGKYGQDLVFDAGVTASTVVGQAMALGLPMAEYAPASRQHAEYAVATDEILARIAARRRAAA